MLRQNFGGCFRLCIKRLYQEDVVCLFVKRHFNFSGIASCDFIYFTKTSRSAWKHFIVDDRITEWKGLDSLEPFMANCSSCAHCGIVDSGNRKCLEAGNRISCAPGPFFKENKCSFIFHLCPFNRRAVSIVGAIGFIGLIGPHIAKPIVGEDARKSPIISKSIKEF